MSDTLAWLQNLMKEDVDSEEKTASDTSEEVDIEKLAGDLEKLAKNWSENKKKEETEKSKKTTSKPKEDEDDVEDKKAEDEVKKVVIDKALQDPETRDKLLQAKKAGEKEAE